MKKKKLKAKIKKLEMQVIEARASAVAAHIAKMLVGGKSITIPKTPEAGEPEIIGKLRRMAEAAAARGKSEP